MRLLAIFPARHDSKRLPNKNFKDFFGRPMLAWPLHESVQSELFDKIVISTDKRIDWVNKIQTNGGLTNVEVHMRRGKAMDYKSTVDDICLDVLEKYKDYDYICCIYPTSYAITWKVLCESFAGMLMSGADNCQSVDMLNHKLDISSIIEIDSPNTEVHPQSEIIDNGGFYWRKVDNLMKDKKIVPNSLYTWKRPQVDINTMQDFAEAKIHALELPCGRFK